MTELEKELLNALEQMQNEQQVQQKALWQMFENTKQDNQNVRESFKSVLESISEADQTRNTNLNKLVRLVNSLNGQLQDFKTQNKALIEQLQALETQVSKLKK